MATSSFTSPTTEDSLSHASAESVLVDAAAVSDLIKDELALDETASGTSGQAPTILIVSESSHIVNCLRKRLADVGLLGVRSVSEGMEAIDRVYHERPDLVLVDTDLSGRMIVLAAMNGDRDNVATAILSFTVAARASASASPEFCLVDSTSSDETHSALVASVRKAILNPMVNVVRESGPVTEGSLVVREPRFVIPHGQTLRGTMSFDLGGEDIELPVQFRDLSTQGAKFELALPPTPGTMIKLKLIEPKAQVDVVIEAEARWCQPSSKQICRVGCRFETPLSLDVLQRLATLGLLERRTTDRKKVMITTQVKEELGGVTLEAGTIVDYSAEGIRLNLPSSKEVGQRLLVHCSRADRADVAVPVRALWQRSVDGRFEVGCCFLNKGGFELIQRIDLSRDAAPTKVNRSRLKSALRLSGIWWVGLFAILALGLLCKLDELESLILWWSDAIQNGHEVFDEIRRTVKFWTG